MVYFKSDNIISSLGISTEENFTSMVADKIGITTINNLRYYPEVFPASMINEGRLDREFSIIAIKYKNNKNYTKLEKMIIVSVVDALSKTDIDITSNRTAIILSTTKGNIDLLSNDNKDFFNLIAQLSFSNPVQT